MAKVSIKNLEQYGNQGWMWTEIVTNEILDETVTRECHTNALGDGLWWGDKQVAGTCQFSLPAKRKAAYSKIRREALQDAEG